MIHHIFTPRVQAAQSNATGMPTVDTTFGEQRTTAQEMTLYVEDDWSITEALKVNGGVSLSGFLVDGRFYPSLQPRLSGRFLLTEDISIKAG